jgi:hypothetical protein
MKSKSSGVAVVAVLIGVAVAVTLYIASYGKSSVHADIPPVSSPVVATQDLSTSDAAFSAAPMQPASGPHQQSAGR